MKSDKLSDPTADRLTDSQARRVRLDRAHELIRALLFLKPHWKTITDPLGAMLMFRVGHRFTQEINELERGHEIGCYGLRAYFRSYEVDSFCHALRERHGGWSVDSTDSDEQPPRSPIPEPTTETSSQTEGLKDPIL